MTELSRRAVLAGWGGLGVAAAVSQSFVRWSHAAAPLDEAEFEELRQRWIDVITGRDVVDSAEDVFEASLTDLDETVDEVLGLVVAGDDRTQVFSDQALDQDPSVSGGYTRIASLARAWSTPGSRHHESEVALATALAGLFDLHRLVYFEGQTEFGNWWSWEIGASRGLADCMAMLRDHIADDDLTAYCAAIDHFVPDPWQQFQPPREVVTSEGANRVDLCQAVIIRSIITGDTDRLTHAVEGLSETWQYVTSGNGFFRDGSFVQHSTLGYTGTYGVVLLGGLSKLFALLADSSHDIDDPSRSIIDDSVEESYAPLMYRGQMMDSVRGRAISREASRSMGDGSAAIEAILRLARAVEPELAQRWRGLCRQWIEAARSGTGSYDILDGASIVRTALVHELLASEVAPRPDADGPQLFSGMDRLVHRGRDNRWAMTVAMCSNRIAWYECGNGENDLGAQTSSGMTYLYLDNDDAHFDDEFWPTSDLTAPPGTTVDTVTLPPRVEGQWGANCPPNEWTGGTTLGEWSLAGQHLIGPGSTGLAARKTWLAGPDFVACLGSDVSVIPQAEDVRFDVTADAHVNDGNGADENYASHATLLVKNVAEPDSGYSRQAFVQITPEVVDGEITTVQLHLHARINDSGGTTDAISIHRCDDFDEQTLTWHTRPQVGEALATVQLDNNFAWHAIDLTASVAAQVAAGEPITLAVLQPLDDGQSAGLSVEIRSRDAGPATAPYLSVGVSAGTDGRTKSVVEHRNTGTAPGKLVVDRHQVRDAVRLVDPAWAHLSGVAGYIFLAPATVRASIQERSGTWRDINTGGSQDMHSRHYASLEVLHRDGSDGTYAYLVIPQASQALTMARAKRPPVDVLANDPAQQAVRSGNLIAMNFWQPGTIEGITVSAPASLLIRDEVLTISDPTQQGDELIVELDGLGWSSADGDGVSTELDGQTLRLRIVVADRIGVPVDIILS